MIGRSRGAEIKFDLTTGQSINVFTTRPETLYGVTYLVLAPDHALVSELEEKIENWSEVAAYAKATGEKSERERLDAKKEKTGVELKGVQALHPATKEALPVYIADYVIAGYGSGAVMAVPAHDERDHAFAEKFNLPVVVVVEEGKLINSGQFTGLEGEKAQKEVLESVSGSFSNTYRLRDWSIGRQRYWGVPIPMVYDPEGTAHPIPEEHLPWNFQRMLTLPYRSTAIS